MLYQLEDVMGGEPGEPIEAPSKGEAALMALDRLGYNLDVIGK